MVWPAYPLLARRALQCVGAGVEQQALQVLRGGLARFHVALERCGRQVYQRETGARTCAAPARPSFSSHTPSETCLNLPISAFSDRNDNTKGIPPNNLNNLAISSILLV